jgi:hypothetical protein
MNERLIDLDELVLRCKEEVTRNYIKEAVACYKAGAFRSCIISTWNAVVFDYLSKLRQLQITGDAEAIKQLEIFQSCRTPKKEDYAKLWQFEVSFPKIAQEKFQFISLIEQEDLERLNQDRSRCAHPSILLDDEPFQATPELARYHLRNAVMHFLQYPPVHGRVAIASVWNMINSSGFPENTEDAIKILKDSYLSRARETLIKDIVIDLTHGLLREEEERPKQRRMYAALEAISQLHFEQFQKVISDKLLTIIESLGDKNWPKLFNYLRRMQLWDFLNEKQKIQAKTFIQSIRKLEEGKNAFMFLNALDSPEEIQAFALEKLEEFHPSDLTRLIELIIKWETKIKNKETIFDKVVQPYKDYAIREFINPGNFFNAVSYGKQLILVASFLSSEEIKLILKTFCENSQVWDANKKVPEVMITLFKETIKTYPLVKNEWFLVKEKIKNCLRYKELLQLIKNNCSDKEVID